MYLFWSCSPAKSPAFSGLLPLTRLRVRISRIFKNLLHLYIVFSMKNEFVLSERQKIGLEPRSVCRLDMNNVEVPKSKKKVELENSIIGATLSCR